MNCCINDLRDKDVINICNGQKLGSVCDVEVDICTGRLTAILVPPCNKLFCFSKAKNIRIAWCDIKKIGEDTILVSVADADV